MITGNKFISCYRSAHDPAFPSLTAVADADHSLEEHRFHDLRHTHVAFLVKNRETPKAIAERLGWSDTHMIDYHGHNRPDIQEDVVEAFGAMFHIRIGNKSIKMTKTLDFSRVQPVDKVPTGTGSTGLFVEYIRKSMG